MLAALFWYQRTAHSDLDSETDERGRIYGAFSSKSSFVSEITNDMGAQIFVGEYCAQILALAALRTGVIKILF